MVHSNILIKKNQKRHYNFDGFIANCSEMTKITLGTHLMDKSLSGTQL